MKYTICWSCRALDAVAQLWLDNPAQRAEITEATATVDQLLQYDPHQRGESRNDDRRILFVPPLVVVFSADADRKLVRVLNVRQLKRGGAG